MSRQQSKCLVDKFLAAETDIDTAMKRYENYVGNQIANVASSAVSSEMKLKAFILAMRNCEELQDLKKQISSSSKSCKIEVCNVNSGFLKFVHLHVRPENNDLARLLCVESDVKRVEGESVVGIKKRKSKCPFTGFCFQN